MWERRKKVLLSFKCFMPAAKWCSSSTHQTSLSSSAHNTSTLVSLLSLFHSVSWLTPLACWTAAKSFKTLHFKTHTATVRGAQHWIRLVMIILSYIGLINIYYRIAYYKVNILYVTMQNMHNASGYIGDVVAICVCVCLCLNLQSITTECQHWIIHLLL